MGACALKKVKAQHIEFQANRMDVQDKEWIHLRNKARALKKVKAQLKKPRTFKIINDHPARALKNVKAQLKKARPSKIVNDHPACALKKVKAQLKKSRTSKIVNDH